MNCFNSLLFTLFWQICEMKGDTNVLRSGFTLDGQRIFLEYVQNKETYRLGTRWVYLLNFDRIEDACDAFEVLEFLEGEPKELAKHIKTEIKRTPRHRVAQQATAMARVVHLVRNVEFRLAGKRPVMSGSKCSVVSWV